MTITDKLEGLLPANGPETKDDHIIAEAVAELREACRERDELLAHIQSTPGGTLDAVFVGLLAGIAIASLVAGVW